MNELLARIIDAHGGMDRWKGFEKVDATIVSGGGLFALKDVTQDPNPRRMTVWLHDTLWRSRSAHYVYARKDRNRKTRWRSCCGALRAQGLVCRPPDDHTMGPAASCLFQWRGPLDLSHHAFSSRDGWCAGRGNRVMAGGLRDVASAACPFPGLDRDALSHSRFFLR